MKNKKGFTLIELLAVIAIIAILMVFVIPAIINVYNNFQKKAFITEAKSVYRAALNKIDSDNFKNEIVEEYNSVDKKVAINNKKINYLINISNNKNINSFCVSNGKYKILITDGETVSIDELEKDDYFSVKTDDELSCVSSLLGDVNVVAIYVDVDGDGEYIDEVNNGKVVALDPDTSYVLDSANSVCDNGETISWSNITKSLTISPLTASTNCKIYFKKSRLLLDYVSYVEAGDYGTTYNTLIGKYVISSYSGGVIPDPNNNSAIASASSGCKTDYSANKNLINDTVGDCNISTSRCASYTNDTVSDLSGWRVLYSDSNNVYIVTSMSPQCIKKFSYNCNVNNLVRPSSSSVITLANEQALKYCNNNFVEGGTCSASNIWALNGTDYQSFSNQTKGLYNLTAGHNISACSGINSNSCYWAGITNYSTSASKNNITTLIDNGENYYYSTAYNSNNLYYWRSTNKYVTDISVQQSSGTYYWSTSTYRYENSSSVSIQNGCPSYMSCGTENMSQCAFMMTYGLRIVMKLDGDVFVTSGSGTYENPYVISY